MEKPSKRLRGSNWNHAQTMALAKLKREASLNEEHGPLVWERIAQTLSSKFLDQTRTGDQCRRRWDTLVKAYKHIEDYCVVTGAQGHRELDEGELASMKLDTAYHQDWYDIVEQVCRQRKRKKSDNHDLMLAERSEGSAGSHSVELPDRLPARDTLGSASTSKSVTHHELSTPESTATYAQGSSSPSLEADKLGPEEEVPRLENGKDALRLEATQVWQLEQTLESANLLPHTILAENEDQIEQSKTESELTEPFDWDLESGGLGAQPKAPVQYNVWDDWYEPSSLSSGMASICYGHLGMSVPLLPPSLPPSPILVIRGERDGGMSMDAGGAGAAGVSGCALQGPRRRWSLKVILSKIRQSCLARGRKERIEDLEMESKQAARLKEKALMPRKENFREMLNAASPTSATSATRGDSSLQKDTERISKQSALDKKEEETRSRKAPERQQVASMSSSKCVPVGKWCAKWSRKLFPAFHGQPSY